MAPKIGGSREIPAYFLLSVLLKLLSTCCGVAELPAGVMICLIALLLKNKKLVCLLSCRQAYWIIDMIHSISKVYTPATYRLDRTLVGYSLNIKGIYTDAPTEEQQKPLGIHSISMVYTPTSLELCLRSCWIFTQYQWYIHPVDWNTLNSNRISQKLSEFFECLDVGDKPV